MASKKDYEAIAQIIKDLTTEEGDIAQGYLMEELSDYFEKDNPKFDRDKFYKACYEKGMRKEGENGRG